MTQDLPPCTVETCDRPTQEYLCHQCTDELRVAWCQIVPLLPVLLLISRNQEQAFTQKTAGGRGGTTGSKPPINISAMQLLDNLRQALVFTPNEYAGHSDGAWSKWMIEDQVERARIMVHGEQEDAESKANIAKYKLRDIHPMPGNKLVEWFRDELKIELTLGRIRKWALRGYIKPANTHGHPKYHPVAVYAAYTERTANGAAQIH